MNDGACAAEIHKFRHQGEDNSGTIFGRPTFEAIAQGFGLIGAEIRDLARVPDLFKEFSAQREACVWNLQISDQVVAPTMRRNVVRGHGKM